MNEQYYKDAFNYCKENRGGHLLVEQRFDTPPGQIWPNSSVGYCSRCMCILSQVTISGIHFGVWINPKTYEILEIKTIEESERKRV